MVPGREGGGRLGTNLPMQFCLLNTALGDAENKLQVPCVWEAPAHLHRYHDGYRHRHGLGFVSLSYYRQWWIKVHIPYNNTELPISSQFIQALDMVRVELHSSVCIFSTDNPRDTSNIISTTQRLHQLPCFSLSHQLSCKGSCAVPNPGKSEETSLAWSYLISQCQWRECK